MDINVIETNITPLSDLKSGNRPLFITIYSSNKSVMSIYEKDTLDKQIYNKKMFDGHFYIGKNGRIYKGRSIENIGEFASEGNVDFNDNNIGICIEGDFSIDFLNNVQKQSLILLVKELKYDYSNIRKIYFLRDLLTDCKNPGDLFPFNEIISELDNYSLNDSYQNLKKETLYRFGGRELIYNVKNLMNGNDVLYLQTILEKLSYNIKKNSIYDLDTMYIVKTFQDEHGLKTDGIIDSDDYEELNKILNKLNLNVSNTFNRILEFNENNLINGDDVKFLQEKLIQQGYSNCNSTGFYDETTESIIRKIQSLNNINIDGKVGPITWQKVVYYNITLDRVLRFKMPMMYGEDIELLQEKLNYLGYKCPISGYYDILTENQIKLFQTKNNILATGEVDEKLYKQLFNTFNI